MGEKKFTFECKIKEIHLKIMSESVADVWCKSLDVGGHDRQIIKHSV